MKITPTHKLMSLPFSEDALIPFISKETISYHYHKHHKGYVDKLNALVSGTYFENMSLIETLRKSNGEIFNNAAQVWNHDFFWKSLAPKTRPPSGAFLRAIEKSFSDFQHFNDEIRKAAAGVFGSGWVWVLMESGGKIFIETTPNADTPIKHGKTPLLVVDVWEHAYYLDYKNERDHYLESIVKVLNWQNAEQLFGEMNYSAAV